MSEHKITNPADPKAEELFEKMNQKELEAAKKLLKEEMKGEDIHICDLEKECSDCAALLEKAQEKEEKSQLEKQRKEKERELARVRHRMRMTLLKISLIDTIISNNDSEASDPAQKTALAAKDIPIEVLEGIRAKRLEELRDRITALMGSINDPQQPHLLGFGIQMEDPNLAQKLLADCSREFGVEIDGSLLDAVNLYQALLDIADEKVLNDILRVLDNVRKDGVMARFHYDAIDPQQTVDALIRDEKQFLLYPRRRLQQRRQEAIDEICEELDLVHFGQLMEFGRARGLSSFLQREKLLQTRQKIVDLDLEKMLIAFPDMRTAERLTDVSTANVLVLLKALKSGLLLPRKEDKSCLRFADKAWLYFFDRNLINPVYFNLDIINREDEQGVTKVRG